MRIQDFDPFIGDYLVSLAQKCDKQAILAALEDMEERQAIVDESREAEALDKAKRKWEAL